MVATITGWWWTDNDLVDTISSLSMNIEEFPDIREDCCYPFLPHRQGQGLLCHRGPLLLWIYFHFLYSVFIQGISRSYSQMHLELNFFFILALLLLLLEFLSLGMCGFRKRDFMGSYPSRSSGKRDLFPWAVEAVVLCFHYCFSAFWQLQFHKLFPRLSASW